MLAAAALNPYRAAPETPEDVRWMNAASAFMVWVVLAMVLAAVLLMITRQPFFNLKRVELAGDLQRNNVATVRANVVSRLAGGFFSVDLMKTREVFESVPWVRKAIVRRVWPNELRITLEEHRPAAYWEHDDRDDQLVNTFGEVFDANIGDVEDERLPTLQAPAKATASDAKTMLDMLQKLRPVLSPLGAEIETVRLTDRGSWSVVLDDDARIELGRGTTDEVLARTERFVRTLPEFKRQYSAPLQYADLRYPEGYAVRLKGLSTWQDGNKPPVIKPAKPQAKPSH
ncbi:MAG: cell division protein FtsQ/DivIB [Burkholderiales bacterium]|nr:cell division protein FtsQ/DivIB [Burkholderiales bacterium]